MNQMFQIERASPVKSDRYIIFEIVPALSRLESFQLAGRPGGTRRMASVSGGPPPGAAGPGRCGPAGNRTLRRGRRYLALAVA